MISDLVYLGLFTFPHVQVTNRYLATIDTLGNGELTTAWHLMNPFRAEGEEDVVWNRGRVLLQSHEEFAYDVIIGVAASGFYGPKDIGFFAFDDVELVRRSVRHEFLRVGT